ncbi:MAG: hypothetical protein EB059_06180 [Alphaproteobacteria bacterium]|nr:hypothetical protein [Alphaproteobacteria bacterium]
MVVLNIQEGGYVTARHRLGAFGDAAFCFTVPSVILKRRSIQPNDTFHVSGLTEENKPTAIIRATARGNAGVADASTTPAPKGKAPDNQGEGISAIFRAVKIWMWRPSPLPGKPGTYVYMGRDRRLWDMDL